MGPTGCGKSQVRLWIRTKFIGIIAKSILRLLTCSLASLEGVLKIPFNPSPRMLLLFGFWTMKHTVAISFWLTHLVSTMWIGATRKSWRWSAYGSWRRVSTFFIPSRPGHTTLITFYKGTSGSSYWQVSFICIEYPIFACRRHLTAIYACSENLVATSRREQ